MSARVLGLFLTLFLLAQVLLGLEHPGDSIPVSASLKSGDLWISGGGTFAIGLVKGNDPAASTWQLRIWYRVPGTFIWTAQTTTSRNAPASPLQVSSNASLSIRQDGLYAGESAVFSCPAANQSCVQRASMQEDGNFVLFGARNQRLWESFSSPTDTLVAGQLISGPFSGEEKVLLVSGKFKLRLQPNILQLESADFTPPDRKAYWTMFNENFNESLPKRSPRLEFSKDGLFKFTDATGTVVNKYTTDHGQAKLRRIFLQPDGNLRIYSLSAKNDSWDVVWQAVLEECRVYARCGAFGICSYSPTAQCHCPPGFKFTEDGGSCVRNSQLLCNGTKFVEVNRADYYYNDAVAQLSGVSVDECKETCMQSCDCLAAAYKLDGSGTCYIKGEQGKGADGKLYNGRQALDEINMVFIKVSNDTTMALATGLDPFVTNLSAIYLTPILKTTSEVQPYFAKGVHLVVVALAAAELVLFSGICGMLLLAWKWDRRRMRQKYAMDIEGAPAKFSFKELQVATKNFSEKLGSGGFGTVYLGVLPDKRMVAVKQLDEAHQAEKQFKAEVSTIGKIHHINLVRLLGYCAEGNHRLLVLEYMPKGSLEQLLFSDEGVMSSWKTRYSVALGIARGITYLHEECHECILHCDIKPQNILLDEQLVPKVADFGLAKLVNRERAFSVTTIAGTRGYIAPEWVSNMQITAKVDVYSFGMMLLETLSGRRNLRFSDSGLRDGNWNFPPWAFQKCCEGDWKSIADSKLVEEDVDWQQFEKMVKVAFWCIQFDPDLRPSMNRVVQMLEDNAEVATPPPPTA